MNPDDDLAVTLIGALMRLKGLRLRDMDAAVGVRPTNLSKFLRGIEKTVSRPRIEQMLVFLGVVPPARLRSDVLHRWTLSPESVSDVYVVLRETEQGFSPTLVRFGRKRGGREQMGYLLSNEVIIELELGASEDAVEKLVEETTAELIQLENALETRPSDLVDAVEQLISALRSVKDRDADRAGDTLRMLERRRVELCEDRGTLTVLDQASAALDGQHTTTRAPGLQMQMPTRIAQDPGHSTAVLSLASHIKRDILPADDLPERILPIRAVQEMVRLRQATGWLPHMTVATALKTLDNADCPKEFLSTPESRYLAAAAPWMNRLDYAGLLRRSSLSLEAAPILRLGPEGGDEPVLQLNMPLRSSVNSRHPESCRAVASAMAEALSFAAPARIKVYALNEQDLEESPGRWLRAFIVCLPISVVIRRVDTPPVLLSAKAWRKEQPITREELLAATT